MSVTEAPFRDRQTSNSNGVGKDQRPLRVLVVQPVFAELVAITSALSRTGFHVTAANSFRDAKPLLGRSTPDVLIAALRLDAYNGLHLVLRGRSLNPQLAALVTATFVDAGTQRDADDIGATLVQLPVLDADLVAAVLQTHFRRGTNAPPVRPPFERRLSDRRVFKPVDEDQPGGQAVDRRRVLPWIVPVTTPRAEIKEKLIPGPVKPPIE